MRGAVGIDVVGVEVHPVGVDVHLHRAHRAGGDDARRRGPTGSGGRPPTRARRWRRRPPPSASSPAPPPTRPTRSRCRSRAVGWPPSTSIGRFWRHAHDLLVGVVVVSPHADGEGAVAVDDQGRRRPVRGSGRPSPKDRTPPMKSFNWKPPLNDRRTGTGGSRVPPDRPTATPPGSPVPPTTRAG